MAPRPPLQDDDESGPAGTNEQPARQKRNSATATSSTQGADALRHDKVRHLKVLVADDDVDSRTMYGLYLRRMGCAVFIASDGESAVDQATAVLPDLIVLDLLMPHVSGWAAAKRLRRSPLTRRIPIVALTAVAGARASARMSGCDAFLSKPCLPQLLWCEIRLLLGLDQTATPGSS